MSCQSPSGASARVPAWRITQSLVLAAPWDERWKAGDWVHHRSGHGAQVVAACAKMTPEQRSRFEALPYGQQRVDVGADDALARLEAEAAARRPLTGIDRIDGLTGVADREGAGHILGKGRREGRRLTTVNYKE